MRIFLRPTGLHSRAMVRVADALTRHAPRTPPSFRPVGTPREADLQILHVISYDAIEYAAQILARGGRYAVIQYCLGHPTEILWDAWRKLWAGASLVWSYFPLDRQREHATGRVAWDGLDVPPPFYYAPLGVDEKFRACGRLLDLPGNWPARRNRILTSGYVSGPRAEPIEEVWRAADLVGMEVAHLGPAKIEGMSKGYQPARLVTYSGITDTLLAELYATSTWVSGLRHVEGFELPAAEGLVCGARPLVFDQPSMRHWYHGHAVFVEESSGDELVQTLVNRFQSVLPQVTAKEREDALARFNWETIAKGFWEALLA